MRIITIKQLVLFIYISSLLGCSDNSKPNSDIDINTTKERSREVKLISYSVINTVPHDTTLFTEGLVFHKNNLYESTGSPEELPFTKSLIGVTNIKTGGFRKILEIDSRKFFGEGLAFFNDRLYQLTYKNKVAFVYNASSLKKVGELPIPSNEGWGLTEDGTSLIMSDGSNILLFLDPETFAIRRKMVVLENGIPVNNLNELEIVNGYIYANVFTTNQIVKIDLVSGQVIGKIDLSRLFEISKMKHSRSLELNGIAYNDSLKTFYVTGKCWPWLFEIQLGD